MAEQLAACARQLFEGAAGGGEQRAANAWLMQFQAREEAWQAALQLLERPARDPATQRALAAPELVAMQILRLKTQHEWARISLQQQQVVRQTLLKLLMTSVASDGGLSPVSCRLACVTLADIVVKSCRGWTSWKRDVQQLVDAGIAAQRRQKAAAVLAEILGAIPLQIVTAEKCWTEQETHEMLTIFQAEGEEVMTAVQMILTSIPEETTSAIRCLEGWIVGCVPTHEGFGLTAAHLFSRGLIEIVFNVAISGHEEQTQLAAQIIADSFVYTASLPVSENTSELRHSTGDTLPKEQQTIICRGISRIACSLAMNHAPVLFSRQVTDAQASFTITAAKQQQHFSTAFLELLLACSSYEDIDVVQPTLEIWFFFLEDNLSQNEVSWQLLDAAGQDHVISVLSRLVNALIERCKYPQWFVETNRIVSDDPEIDAVIDLRREIADTMLSLFSKWPGGHEKPNGDYVSCVKGMSQMMADSKDIALIDALLFLLSYMVELFDVVSSDSESEDDPSLFGRQESGGMDVLLEVLDCTLDLPMHPLVINGIARYLRAMDSSLALPAHVYLRASMSICQGLQFASSFSIAVQSLLHNSLSITKYTTIEERAPLLQALLRFYCALDSTITQENEGDLLDVVFRVADGVSDADFETLCSSVLPSLLARVQSSTPTETSKGIYLLGRGLEGVQDQHRGSALVEQLWPYVSSSLLHNTVEEACQRAGVQFFLNAIPSLPKHGAHAIEAQILDVCLRWYGDNIAPDILTCCAQIISRQRGNAGFQALAGEAFERLLLTFRRKLHDVSGTGAAGQSSMEYFLTQSHEADKMISEVEQFMKLAREMLNSFPQVLMKSRRKGEPALFWVCLDLATRLMNLDHKMQEMCDAACDFLLVSMRSQPEAVLEKINLFATEVLRVVLSYLGPKGEHYRVRNFWDFLFQCIHAPQTPVEIRGGFLSAVSVVVIEEGALRLLLPADVCQQIPGELRMRRQKHRFRQYFSQLVKAGVEKPCAALAGV